MTAPDPTSPHLSAPSQDGRVTVAKGVELGYIDRGAGGTIIFIPGWTFTKEIFEKQIGYLARSYRVIAYDPRSQGGSSITMAGNDYTTHAEDLAALIDALRVETPILVGWGAGAHTAWGYVKLRGPEAIAANVTIDMPPKCLSFDPDVWVEGTLDEIGAIHTVFLRDARGQAEYVRNRAETVMVERGLFPEEVDWIVRQSAGTRHLIASQLFASCMFADHTAEAITIAQNRPTLFYVAQHWSNKAVPFLKRLLPESRYVVFGGHMMFWEHPDAFNQVLDEFIQLYVNVG
jgi:pimeloyl-ACP methyl ester carboxylesterase